MTEPTTTTCRYCKKPADDQDGLCSVCRCRADDAVRHRGGLQPGGDGSSAANRARRRLAAEMQYGIHYQDAKQYGVRAQVEWECPEEPDKEPATVTELKPAIASHEE